MTTLLNQLAKKFTHAVHEAFPGVKIPPNMIEITQSTQEKFGHYQCNSAMKLSKLLEMNPRQIAGTLISHLNLLDSKDKPMISQCEIAGPGFINITLETDFLARETEKILRTGEIGIDKNNGQHRVIIDFSSPNTAKEMQVWHLRSTIIGDCLARLFEFLGFDVLRLNHVGDWGTAFGMLIAYMKEEAPDILSGKEQTTLTHLVGWYKRAKQRFDEDADFKKRSQLEVVAIQRGDKNSLQAWEIICDISRKAYQEVYDLLDVNIIERGESFYNPMLQGIITDLENKHLITISDGAKCVMMEGFVNREGEMLPLIVQKSDGGFNYAATDMAAIRHRVEEEKGERLIYITDAGQSMHFQMVFKAAELAHYFDPAKVQINHVPFGLVLDAQGKKFKTRSSETERLIDLLYAAISKAKDILIQREVKMTPQELEKTATVLGINAIKYADLSNLRTSDYVFSYDRMLRFEGNTAAFLMYAYVRVNGIKRKVGVDIEILKRVATIQLSHPTEIALALQLNQFGETLEFMAKDLLPHRLTEYLFNLADKFNAFFRDCRVEGDAAETSRLLLCETVAFVLRQGMSILGLKVVDRM